MQRKNISRNSSFILDRLNLEQTLSSSHHSSQVIQSCHKKNISLAKQNSDLRSKVSQLEEKLYLVNAELFEVKCECNSLAQNNKKLEIQKERLRSIGRYGTRYFEKLGRSTEIMVERFRKSLALEQDLNISGMLTPSVISDSALNSEKRELEAIKEEAYSLDLTQSHNGVNTPILPKKPFRSHQLFAEVPLEEKYIKSNNKKFYSLGNKNEDIEFQVTPKNRNETPVKMNSSNLTHSKQTGIDKENGNKDNNVFNRMNLRSGIRKSYISLPQNRKLRQGDNQFLDIKDEEDDNIKFGSAMKIYDLTE